MRRMALVLAACLAAGCGLGAHPDRTRFFTLTPLRPDEARADGGQTTDLMVGLGPVVLPASLDRTPLVRRTKDNEIGVSGIDRWAEPLGYAFATTLRQNLVVLLGTPRIVLHPWLPGPRPDLAVQVDVLRFEPGPTGEVDLTAEWHVRRVADGKVLVGRLSRIAEPANGKDSDEVAAALSRALGAFSREIAMAVRDEHSAGRDRASSRPRPAPPSRRTDHPRGRRSAPGSAPPSRDTGYE